ncbi:MAG: transcriptional regulator [Candidatus Marinimicrobia bacterium]|nr:transcriptional regulator [Candidatus Neomarinimicrobiota bacterium]
MSEHSQIQRLIRILQILSSGRKITTKELRRRFDNAVSLRTLQRDLLALSEAGIPLITEKTMANENAWSLMSRFRSFVPLPLETNEYLAAHMLKANLKVFQKTPFEKEINSLIHKIDQIVPEDVFLETESAGAENLFENYSAGIFDYSPHGETINNLISAIVHRTKCKVTYYNPYEQKEKSFHIEPEKMVHYNGGLYAIVFIRHYKSFIMLAIQRIRKLVLLDESFPKDHPFKESEYWKGKFGLFPGEQVVVKLQFNKDIRHHIEGRTWHSSQTVEIDKKGNLILTMKVGITPELISWILGWRMYVKVLEPKVLVEEIKSNLIEMKEMYKTT